MNDKSLETLDHAISKAVHSDYPHEVTVILQRAWLEAREQREELDAEGLSHLRTFLKTTPLGLAILDLAHYIIERHSDE